MKIKDLIILIKGDVDLTDELVQEILFVITGGIRTEVQFEASTFEGDCVGVLNWIRTYGPATVENFKEWMLKYPSILEYNISEKALFDWAKTNEEKD